MVQTGDLVYGYHPVRERLRSRPQTIERILVSASRGGQRRREIEEHCHRHRIVLQPTSEAELRDRAGGGDHNGFVALLRSVGPNAPPSPADAGFRVLVEDVQDPRNLGALLRVCEGAGVERVLIRDRGSAPLTPTVVKTSAGAVEWLSVERIVNSARIIEDLKGEGFWVYGAAMDGEAPWSLDLTGPVLLCFGGEEKGLRSRTRGLCDALIGLPMRGRVGSLNLATAAAALLYEAVRQRAANSPDTPLASPDRRE